MTTAFYRLQKLHVRFKEFLDPFLEELVRDSLHGDACSLDRLHRLLCLVDIATPSCVATLADASARPWRASQSARPGASAARRSRAVPRAGDRGDGYAVVSA